MNDDANTLRKQVASRFEASPTRYILIGIGLILLMILGCITTVWFVGNTTPPAPPPASKARVELLSAVQRNQPLAIRGSGFQPNERVEIYAAPGQNAGFGQMVKLGDAVSDGNGGFSVAAPYPQNLPDGALFVTAKGATTGFVGFAAAPGGAAAVPQPGPTQVPAPAGATPPSIPVQGAANLPDLAIGSLSIAPQAPTTCINTTVQPTLGVLVEIRNTTPYPSGPFVVQVNNTQYAMNNGLPGAGSITLWFSGYQTGINRVALDTANQVKELEETRNNVLELPLTVPAPYPQCSAAPPAPSTATPQPAVGPSATPDPNALNVWYAQYYNSQDLFEPATIRRYEPGNPFLNLDWRGGSPGAGLPNDGFSGALTRVQEFPSTDNYVFDFTVDDGGRLFIDGVLVIDEWRNGSARTVQASRSLSKGAHTIRIEFYEATSSARVALSWKSSYTGWRGRYYTSTDRTGQPVIIRDDRDPNGGLGLDLDWGFGSPAPEVPVDGFSVDWQRTVNFQQGNYLFTAEIDDGARIFIDGVVLIDNYLTSGNRVVTATRFLNAGAHSIQVQYVEYAGQSKFKLYWDRVLPIPTSTPIPATPIPLVTATPVPPTAVVVPSFTPVATAGGGGPVPPTALPTAVPSNTPVALPSNTPGAGSGAGGIVIIITPAP
jgi:hypothetical protein